MDPQKEIWSGQPGQQYKIKDNKQGNQNESLFMPFVFDEPSSLKKGQTSNYHGTLMRFPLRTEKSELSDKVYDIKKLKSITEALKSDASFLLLFLRCIEKIEVYIINTNNIVIKLFSVEADEATQKDRKALKDTFFNQVKQFHSNPSSISPPTLQYEVTIKVDDIEKDSHKNHRWSIANRVGSTSKQILEATQRLPWLGLAASLDSQGTSRLFCFLPMPDSEEVNPPLPFCVHGTFGLTNDRRHLKWKTSDMQNDDGALWNDLLLSEMLPLCYAEFLNDLKHKVDRNVFYSFWPNVPIIKQTHWENALQPLLSILLKDQLFWSKSGSWVKLQSSVHVVPQVSSGEFPQVVINALNGCGKEIVVLDDRVWKSVEYIYKAGPYPFTTITPSLVRQALKDNAVSYKEVTRPEKFDLLHYCLKDCNYKDLSELLLLPVVNGDFVAFSNNLVVSKLYVCNQPFLQTGLLANNKDVLVHVEAEDSDLHQKLIEVADSNCTQLKLFTIEDFAMILEQISPFKNDWCSCGSTGDFNENWLKTFWDYVQLNACQLSEFVGIRLLPVCYNKNSNGFKVVALQTKSMSQVIKYSQSVNFSSELINAAGKLDCYLTCREEFQFLYHPELANYVHDLTPSSLLTISSQMRCYQNAKFTSVEARELRRFIFQHSDKPVKLNECQKSVGLKLKIFPALQHNNLFSLESAKCKIAGHSGAMILLDPTCLDRYTPYLLSDPLILTCTECKSESFESVLPGCSWFPTKLQIILYVIIPAIESHQLMRESTLNITSALLEENEYHSLLINRLDESESNQLIKRLTSLKFVPISGKSELYLPSQVYDPEDHNITELFADENAFPLEPFSKIHFVALRKLGMKTTSTLEASDIIRVAQSIFNQANSNAKLQKASNLIKFLCTNQGNTLLNTYDKNYVPLEKTLQSIEWLPVTVDPPEDYPGCLEWKGATGSQFVSAEQIHASGLPNDHKKLPYLIGSQMKILQYEGILSDGLISSFNISQNTPLDLTIQQFLKLLYNKDDDTNKDKCMELLYDHLRSAVLNDSDCEHWNLLRDSKVVEVSEENFIFPSLVACSFDESSKAVGNLEPYLYILPDHFQQYRSLFCHIGVKKHITTDDVFSVLKKIESKQSHDDEALVTRILEWLISKYSSDELQQLHEHEKIFVPISSDVQDKLVLKPAKVVAFLDEDLHWLRNDKDEFNKITKDYNLAHPSISHNLASKLQLKSLTMITDLEELKVEQVGQSEPLTTRLKTILKDYKDTSVIQELLQNADDAGATEVAVYYDTREHDSSYLFFPGMVNSYGPAVLFYNNVEFADKDFENITKIAGETKKNEPLKIGKFGIGFCSVYHITDVPSFVSGETFMVFDPTLQCFHKEIKNEFNPGIKVNFHKHRILKKSQQLAPYNGIKGFDSKKRFKGTLFRFPLRSEGGKISENTFTPKKVELMFDRVKQSSSRLLMFLSNVMKISLHHSEGDSFTKEFEVTVTKESVDGSKFFSKLSISAVYIAQNGNCKVEEYLIASNSQNLQSSSNKPKTGTASVSIRVKNDDKANKIIIDKDKGECFCFLPLNIETGLPVHVSSNFAVTTNRRGIWKADNISTKTDESNWNKMLMESVVFKAYIEMLSQLQKLQQKGSLLNYNFSCLWPVDLKEMNPWECLRNKFYESILASQYPLLYSEVTYSWLRLNECKFLSTKVLASELNDELHSSLYHVADVLKLPVVKLPNEIQSIRTGNDIRFHCDKRFAAQVINEEEFVNAFYDDNILPQVDVGAKSTIVAASLMVYVNGKHCQIMPELMKNAKCIPCSPDGKSFKKPQEIIESNSNLAKLFAPESEMFPHENFLEKNEILIQSLRQLGLMKSLSWEQIFDRAKHMPDWYKENSDKTLKSIIILIDCIKENCNKDLNVEKFIQRKLQRFVYLPVMKKPNNYPISWKGDSIATFLTGPELTAASTEEDKISAIFLCGSQVPILDSNFMSYNFTPEVLNVLGIKQDIQVDHVIDQFDELLKHFEKMSESFPISKEVLEYINNINITIYRYLSITLEAGNVLLDLSAITNKACVWNGKEYLLPSNVSFNWMINGPYLYKLPDDLTEYKSLMKKLGVEEEFSTEILVTAICDMKMKYKDKCLPSECQDVFRIIIPKLENVSIGPLNLYLPDENFVLRTVKELRYNDAPWMSPEKKYLYCNECIGRNIAMHLGVETVKNAELERLVVTDKSGKKFSEGFGKNFGQQEKLTDRLKNILKDYPRDITILKEILQNADDARASKLFIMLDKRFHSTEKVISEEWEQLQGPALLFWNDSEFTEEDLIGIQKIGLGNKREDPDKIGQYGIGFNVVYHYTDCPSFITTDKLCILDPHRYYIPHNTETPGVMYTPLEEFWNMFPHMKSSFLQNDTFPVDIKHGSLFRLPLRLTKKDAERSEIVQNDSYFEVEKLEEDFKKWILSMQEALLFVHHVRDVRFFVIDKTKSARVMKLKEHDSIVCYTHVECIIDESSKEIMESGKTKLVMYDVTLSDKKTNKDESWMVQLGEGNLDNNTFDWSSIKPVDMEIYPQHGIAASFDKILDKGKPFCFLPLPSCSYLPVHIHGQFALHSDRQSLWISSSDNATSAFAKVNWNIHMIKAIGISYSYFLRHFVDQNKTIACCTKQELSEHLNNYYNIFPIFSRILEEPWKMLAREVYNTMNNLNSEVLVTLTEDKHLDLQGIKCAANQKYSAKWYNLHKPQALDEGYFHNFHDHDDICMVLKSIGMNLIDTPMCIHEQFKEVGVDLPIISQESVLGYYIRFQKNICNDQKFPCHVSRTRFSKVEHFVSFVKYLSIHTIKADGKKNTNTLAKDTTITEEDFAIKAAKSDGEQDTNISTAKDTMITEENIAKDTKITEEDIAKDTTITEEDIAKDTKITEEDIAAAGLLITVDGCIHALSDGKNIINSKYWHLFPNSKDVFLHKAMIEECSNSGSLFQVSEVYDIIHSVFANNLPPSLCKTEQAVLEDDKISLVKNMLICICDDPTFKHHQQQLLKDFALIPSDNNIAFSSSSKVLPMIDDDGDSFIHTESVLRKLKVHFVNNDVLRSILNDIKIKLLSITKPMDILKAVYFISIDCKDNLISLSDEELNTLFTIFESISYTSDLENVENVFYIKRLPIFTTIHKKRTDLSSASKIWIWNDQACKAGITEWICHIQKSSVIFLDLHAPWALLKEKADYLDIKEISLYELYCDYIFPHFSAMNSAMRIEHIKFISKKMFVDCKRSLDQELPTRFTKDFKNLKCIGDDKLNLHNIGSFYDHTQDSEIFTVFCCNEQCFLPKQLQDDDIQEGLKFFGLRNVPTDTEFLDYCKRVSSFTQISTVTKASQILLNILFQDKSQYQHIYNNHFLKKVSQIPIAIIKSSKFSAIANQHPGDCPITDDNGKCIGSLTKLCGSCIADHEDCIWTCKPLINLPVDCSANIKSRAEALGISLVPSINDVVKNLTNLANTEFAHFSRFHQHGYKLQTSKTAKISCKLPVVVKHMLEYIKEHIQTANFNTCIILRDVSFLPVQIHGEEYALVKPTQVLTMDSSSLRHYYPFLHPLEKSFQSINQFLGQIGVKNSLDFSHIQLLFKLAKDWCKGEKVKFEIKHAVAKATEKLIMLLRKAKNDGTKKGIDLQQLYLLNEQDVLTDCSKLVVFDISGNRLALPREFTYLNSLTGLSSSIGWSPEELHSLLPQKLGLKSLKSILHYETVDCSQLKTPYNHIRTVEKILTSNDFKTAIEKYACFCIHNPQHQPPARVTEIITKFQSNLNVRYLADVIVKPHLNINNEVILLQDTIYQKFFLQYHDNKYILSLKNIPDHYTPEIFEEMSKQLCSKLKLQETNCFNLRKDVNVPELTSFVCQLLKCHSEFKLRGVVIKNLPGFDNIEQELDMEPANPELGEIMPDCWHHRLDQNILNYFMPTEWVGYENESEIIYAQIMHVSDIATSSEDNLKQFSQKKYKIAIGSTQEEAEVLKIFKLIHNLEESVNEFSLLRREEGASADSCQATTRDAVNAVWSLQEEEKKRAIKRLYLQYHPDKNLDNPHVIANFQVLQEEIAKLEGSAFSHSGWSGLFHQWDRTAFLHQKYRSRDKPRESPGRWNIPKPKKEYKEAKRWIKQAEYDYVTLFELEKLSQTIKETCATTCFMSHEVAEKALKAGMYAKCGMSKAFLKSHNLESPARALVQMGCSVDVNDARFLEDFYSQPRFPYCHSSSIVPGEKYLSNTAKRAFLAAKKIYEVCNEAVNGV